VKTTRYLLSALKRGSRRLDRQSRKLIVAFLRSQRGPSGGWHGPDGEDDDLYYSLFGAASLAAVGGLHKALGVRSYLKSVSPAGQDLPHAVSLAALRRMALLSKPAITVAAFATADGGFTHLPDDQEHGTAYGAYLAMLLCQALGQEFPPQGMPVVFSSASRAEAPLTTTAAARLMLAVHGGMEGNIQSLRDSLVLGVCPQGGFSAFPAGVPDLLSTASALAALRASGGVPAALRTPQARFVEACWTDCGGFRESPDHGTPDVEYTFYALLALGAL